MGQQGLGQGAEGHAGSGFAGAGALQDVTRVVEVVLDGAGQVGVTGPRAGYGLLACLRRRR